MDNVERKATALSMLQGIAVNLEGIEREGDLHVDDLIRVQLVINTLQRVMHIINEM